METVNVKSMEVWVEAQMKDLKETFMKWCL
jgi:hypothetical protein